MSLKLKTLREQTLVITGATSGNGLAIARQAARQGAKLMLLARDEAGLASLCEWIGRSGGEAAYAVTDVGDAEAVQAAADAAIARFGGFDTWVNNAGVGVYSRLEDLPLADHHAIFRTNYWGVVHGSLAAVRHFRTKRAGGVLINVGSINADMPTPLLSAYAASKHAVKGFTNSLRLELISQKARVSVTLINPSAIGTPFPQNARNLTGYRARLPWPVYSPELVADAVLDAARRRRRSVTVGGGGRFQVAGSIIAPRLFDQIAARMQPWLVEASHPEPPRPGNLDAPSDGPRAADGRQKGRRFSLYTAAALHPLATRTALCGLAFVAVGLWCARRAAGRAVATSCRRARSSAQSLEGAAFIDPLRQKQYRATPGSLRHRPACGRWT